MQGAAAFNYYFIGDQYSYDHYSVLQYSARIIRVQAKDCILKVHKSRSS